VSTGALALAWLVHRDDVTALITGPARSAPYVGLAAEAFGVRLPDDVADELTRRFAAASA
jgi:aryl-alcohol dehydrogenase-like predicted oxidoreductase